MGRDKAWIEFRGRPLVQHVLEALRPICAELLLVGPETEKYLALGTRLIPDVRPGSGSLGGIYSGLLEVKTEHAIVVACDMPFLSGPLLEYLLAISAGYDADADPRLWRSPASCRARACSVSSCETAGADARSWGKRNGRYQPRADIAPDTFMYNTWQAISLL